MAKKKTPTEVKKAAPSPRNEASKYSNSQMAIGAAVALFARHLGVNGNLPKKRCVSQSARELKDCTRGELDSANRTNVEKF